jgi:uncharacterized protein (TIGR03083 family)
VDGATAYATTRAQLVDLASGLSAEGAAKSVPALPGWTIKDTYAHLAGVASDVLAGRMDGAGSPPWTARQVAERADKTVLDVCEEWLGHTEALAAWQQTAGAPGLFLTYDVWTHQQDVQGALGLGGIRDERLDFLVGSAVGVFDGRLREAGVPAVHIVGETVDCVVGEGTPACSLRAGDYEVMRLLFGRRSQRQIDQMYWDGDFSASIDQLHLFELPEINLID